MLGLAPVDDLVTRKDENTFLGIADGVRGVGRQTGEIVARHAGRLYSVSLAGSSVYYISEIFGGLIFPA